MRYAGWWQRVGAVIIDGIISILFFVPAIIALAAGPSEIDTCTINGEFGLCEVPTSGTIGIGVLLYVAGFVAFLALYCRRVGTKGQSWGMGAAGHDSLQRANRPADRYRPRSAATSPGS